MTTMTLRSLVGLALAGTGLLVGGPVASALTSEVRVVSDFTISDVNTGIYETDTGWMRSTEGTGAVEIGSAYGAPAGLGRDALMLDTPNPGDVSTLAALTDQPGYFTGAFPTTPKASPDLRLGFWLYVSPLSAADSGPVLTVWIGNRGSGAAFGYTIATFDPVRNASVEPGTWTFVDATASDAQWSARGWNDTTAQLMTWPELVEHTSGTYGGTYSYGWFEYGLGFEQKSPGTFSAVDGVTVSTNEWSSVTDFELQPASGKPNLDRCKNNGWKDNFTTDTFKNQGACIASITASN